MLKIKYILFAITILWYLPFILKQMNNLQLEAKSVENMVNLVLKGNHSKQKKRKVYLRNRDQKIHWFQNMGTGKENVSQK